MAKLIVNENVSLDGVVQDPIGDEGFEHGGWAGQITDADRQEWTSIELAEALTAEALLLGRRTDEWFAVRWTSRTGEWADRLNAMPKYVVSRTLAQPHWANSTLLSGEAIDTVAKLKQEVDGEIVVYGSRELARTLMEHDLVDELRLMVYPIVLGTGDRLFGDSAAAKSLRLLSSRPLGTAWPS